jgi:hypothetical protein
LVLLVQLSTALPVRHPVCERDSCFSVNRYRQTTRPRCARASWKNSAGSALCSNEGGAVSIAKSASRVGLYVLRTDEELMIARHTLALLRAKALVT